MTFWLNGEWRTGRDAISIDDRGFLLGDGVFETIFLRRGVPAFLDEHLQRLSDALRYLNINAAAPAAIEDIIRELTDRNGLAETDACLRITVSRGAGGRGLATVSENAAPTVLMTVSPAAPLRREPMRLIISRYPRATAGASVRCKTPAYLDNILAREEAAAAGADDALMLNAAGRVACATAANVFAMFPDGAVATPPIEDGALPGVVRGVLLSRCGGSGVAMETRSIAADALNGVELALTNSLMGVARASLSSSDAAPSKMFKRLQSCYEHALDEDLRRRARSL